MIYHTGQRIERVYRNGQRIFKAYKNGAEVFHDPIAQFITNAEAAGATFIDEDLLRSEFAALHPILRQKEAAVLVPGAYKENQVYGFNNQTGALIPFIFGRASGGLQVNKHGDFEAVGSGIPRITFDPVTGYCRGYLMEKGSTNYVLDSNSFPAGGAWGGTVTTGHMYKGLSFTQGTTTSGSGQVRQISSSIPSGLSRVTVSFFIKKISGTSTPLFGIFVFRTGGTGQGAIRVNIATGAVTSNGTNLTVSTESQHIGDGYYRVAITLHDWLEGGQLLLGYSGDAGGVYQLAELNCTSDSQMTSAIPTGSSQVTRIADTLRSDNDLCIDAAGTAFMRIHQHVNASTFTVTRNNGASAQNGRFWYNDSVPELVAWDGTSTVIATSSYLNEQENKVCTTFGPDGLKICANGNTPVVNTYDGAFGNSGPLSLFTGGTGLIKAFVKSIVILQEQLSNSEMQSITS